jgi:hypothetical protein
MFDFRGLWRFACMTWRIGLFALVAAIVPVASQGQEGGGVVPKKQAKQESHAQRDKLARDMGLDDRRVLDQLVDFYTSSAWREGAQDFNVAVFDIDRTAQLRVEVESWELPEAIAADDLMEHIATESMPYDAAFYRRDQLAKQTFPREGKAPDGNKMLFWSKAMVLGDHVRVAHFSFQMKPGTWETPESATYAALIEWIVQTAEFTPKLTNIDRIAPNKAMKQTSVDDVMRFRVPHGWTRSRQKNWTLFDPGDSKLGVFEANWDLWTSQTPAEKMSDGEFIHMHLTVYQKFPELLGAKDWAIIQDTDHDKSPPERWVTFRKLYTEINRVLVISFQYRVAESIADTPEVDAIDAMFEREVRASVARFPPVKQGKPRAAAKAKKTKS